MAQKSDIRKWVMVTCDVSLGRILETYSGFCVMRIADDKRSWNIEVARFYEGDPEYDYEEALAYAESVANQVLRQSDIEIFWKKLGIKPRGMRRNGRVRK